MGLGRWLLLRGGLGLGSLRGIGPSLVVLWAVWLAWRGGVDDPAVWAPGLRGVDIDVSETW